MIGRLRYSQNPYDGRDGRGYFRCLLMPLDKNVTDPLVQLHHALITIDHRGIRVEGKEDEWRRKERTEYDQVLWCRPIHPDQLVATSRDAIDLEDEAAAIR